MGNTKDKVLSKWSKIHQSKLSTYSTNLKMVPKNLQITK
jgi:hypothetical protein